MNYEEVLSAIHSRKTFSGGGATLTRIQRLMYRLGNPQDTFKTIHVAGTNGKGSTCAMIHAGLTAAGYKTGLFTSPYLKDFRERIQIQGQMISKALLVECYEAVMAQQQKIEQEGYEPVNEFELVTAIAFLAFSRSRLDYVVLEVGLGGRSDPTNLVKKPVVCCITPISLDHTGILGDTIEKIASEKAGIIKSGCPVVVSQQTPEAHAVLAATASEIHAPMIDAPEVTAISVTAEGSRFLWQGSELFLPLIGGHQLENASAACAALQLLGVDVQTVRRGLLLVSWPGRLQWIHDTPDFLIDAGHNEAGVRALCQAIDALFPNRRIISIMAMMKDKDYSLCIPAIARRSILLIGATVGQPRSLTPEEICRIAGKHCPVIPSQRIADAILLAKQHAQPEDLILICGSVYAAGDALLELT